MRKSVVTALLLATALAAQVQTPPQTKTGAPAGSAGTESGFAVIAHHRGMFAEQQQVEIAVVVIIDPNGFLKTPGRQFRRIFLENPVPIAIERRSGICQHAQVRQAVVVEITRGNRPDVFQLLEPGFLIRR